MGLLFVLEGDENGKEGYVDLSMEIHKSIMIFARNKNNGEFPLTRRFCRYYNDALIEYDEISEFIRELHIIYKITNISDISDLIKLCVQASKQNKGIETISD